MLFLIDAQLPPSLAEALRSSVGRVERKRRGVLASSRKRYPSIAFKMMGFAKGLNPSYRLYVEIQENAMSHERIEINPDIMDGKPVVRGTRVPVELVLRKPGAGMSAEAILMDHPRLTLDDIHAAQAFAADGLSDTRP